MGKARDVGRPAKAGERDERGRFVKGCSPGPGRPKGSKNRRRRRDFVDDALAGLLGNGLCWADELFGSDSADGGGGGAGG